MMDSLPDSTLHVKHLADILSDLSGLLSQSWTQETLDDDVGPSWDAYTRNFSDFARHNELRNETKDLSGVYIHQLFSPVNRIAERSEGKLKPETYEPGEMRSAFTPPLSALRVGQHGDHYATLRPQGDSVRRPLQRVAVEKKLLTSVKTIAMVAGVDAARAEAEAGGVGQEGGYTIRKGEDGDGNERYYASEEVETAVIDAVVQVSARQIPPNGAFS